MDTFSEIRALMESGGVAAVEQYRQHKVQQLIDSVDNDRQKQMLRQLQWRIDGICKQHTATGSMLKLSTMMWESVDRLREAVNGLQEDVAVGLVAVGGITKSKPKLTLVT